MHKKGELGEQVSVFMFLFLMFVIGIGIVAGVYIFFGQGYDFREVEANLLSYKIGECIKENEITEEFFEKGNFFEKCRLNKGAVEKNNIIRICSGVEDCMRAEKSLLDAGSNFQACGFEGTKKNEAHPLCATNEFSKGEKKFSIIVGSKQFSRRNLG